MTSGACVRVRWSLYIIVHDGPVVCLYKQLQMTYHRFLCFSFSWLVDLYLMYKTVKDLGGYHQVNTTWISHQHADAQNKPNTIIYNSIRLFSVQLMMVCFPWSRSPPTSCGNRFTTRWVATPEVPALRPAPVDTTKSRSKLQSLQSCLLFFFAAAAELVSHPK